MERIKIKIQSLDQIMDFVNKIKNCNQDFEYIVEDNTGMHCVSAKSYLGMLYAYWEFGEETYFVNKTVDGIFPDCIYDFV